MKNSLSKIINELIETCKEAEIRPDPNVIFEQAVKLMISDNINKSKTFNKSSVPDTQDRASVDEPATEKQVSALKERNMYKEGMTKRQAWKIINDSRKNANTNTQE